MKGLTYNGLKKYKGLICAFVLAAVAAAVFTMLTALSVTDFLQILFPSEGTSGAEASPSLGLQAANPVLRMLEGVYAFLIAQGTQRALFLYALLLLAVYGTKNVMSYLQAVFFARFKNNLMRDIRNGLHRSVLMQRIDGWSQQRQGQWLSRMTADMTEYEANMLDGFQALVQAAISMVIYILMLFYLDWELTLAVLVVMGVGTLLLSTSRRLKRQSRLLQGLNADLVSLTQETLDSLKEIKAATAIDYVNARQAEQNALFTKRRIAIYRRINAASPLSDFIGNTIVVGILMVGAVRVLGPNATMPPALFVSYIMIYVLLLTPIKDLSNAIAQLKKGRGVEEVLMESLPAATELAALSPAAPPSPSPSPVTSIELRDVSFGYGERPVLQHLNWQVAMRHSTAIVGESGSGKTTLGRLVTGLVEEQQGTVLINGLPTTASQRRGTIAYVSQEAMLFNDTVAGNIRMGRDWLTDEDIAVAIRVAQLETTVSRLPNGILTRLGDGGGRLSGGERQRINIARALAGKPDVIVMDEATAALDAATEQALNEALHSHLSNATLLIIAHRASTIARCNEVMNVSAFAS